MSVLDALVPWLFVAAVAVGGAAAGVLAVRRIAPGILAAAETGRAVPIPDGTVESELSPSETGANAEETGANAPPVGTVDATDAVDPADGTDPAAVDVAGTVDAVFEMDRVDAVRTVGTPDPIETTGTTDAVAEADRVDPVRTVVTPAPVETANATDAVAKAVRIDPVPARTAEAAGPDDEAAGTEEGNPDGSAVVCDYCGRDDFETTAQRNGHLRWCDEYDPDASGADHERDSTDVAVDRSPGSPGEPAAVPTPFEPAGAVDVVSETDRLDRVEPTDAPAPVDLAGGTDVVSEVDRLDGAALTDAPAPVDLAGGTGAVSRTSRLGPVDPVRTPVHVETEERTAAVSEEEALDGVEPPTTPAPVDLPGGVDVVSAADRLDAVTRTETDSDARVDAVVASGGDDGLRMDIEAAEIDTDTGAEDDMDTDAEDDIDTDAEDDIDTDAEDDIDTDPDRPDGRPGETTFGRDSPRDGAVEAGATLDDGSEGDAQEDDEDDGSEGIDVVATYATVRGALEREFDIDSRWTSREFYHACKIRGLDEERLTALERLTQAYETVQYGDDPTLDVAELRAAAARFQADTGTSPDAPADEA